MEGSMDGRKEGRRTKKESMGEKEEGNRQGRPEQINGIRKAIDAS